MNIHTQICIISLIININNVNMKQIQSFKDNTIVLKDNIEIKVPKKNFSTVKSIYQDYLFDINGTN